MIGIVRVTDFLMLRFTCAKTTAAATSALLLCALACHAFAQQAENSSYFTDPRDGQIYRTVKIGEQTWMAKNLNYKTGNSYCHGNDESNCSRYGRLYDWNTALGVCPNGWQLPNMRDWDVLVNYAGGKEVAGKRLKSKTGWGDAGGGKGVNGTDEFGFEALPGGRRYEYGAFNKVLGIGNWWSAAVYGKEDGRGAWLLGMYYDFDVVDSYGDQRGNGYSVRCVKDTTVTKDTTITIDAAVTIDSTVMINGLVWTQENLNTTVTINGLVWTQENLNIKLPGIRCYRDEESYCAKYGGLFTWEAAKNACASMGATWRLPTREDWNSLVDYVGGALVAGKKLKSKSGWDELGNGTDEYGFSALPGGSRSLGGYTVAVAGCGGRWWSVTEGGGGGAYYMSIGCSGGSAYMGTDDKGSWSSVRCVMDDPASKSVALSPGADYSDTLQTHYPKGTLGQTSNPVEGVKIGALTWTKQNVSIETPDSWCYKNDDSNCVKYGRLYTWEAANKACANMGGGWRLPTRNDWDNLMEVVGGVRKVFSRGNTIYYNAGKKLKSKTGWDNCEECTNSTGTDNYGFSALGGGFRDIDGRFSSVGNDGNWWSADKKVAENGFDCAYLRDMDYALDDVGESCYYPIYGFSVRCVKD